ncbi:MAG TPA: LysM peptidoglycan-binding domain-containing protein [Planctomycetota bacterium]|nr:LysM peptidoglycan-binding domain-containing protein [Planctomycetota bacterium]
MKRDARIGLAVVLVLGLSVTLLIGRALYRNTEVSDAGADDSVETSAAAAGDDIRRVDGVREASAPMPHTQSTDTSRAETVELPPEAPNTAVREFVQDQTRPINATDRFSNSPTMTPPVETNNRANGSVRPTNGGPNPEDALYDHESPEPVKPEANAVPADGYGYTVAAGDNIWKISSKVYGDGKFTQKIVDANKDINTAKLKPGMVIKIPLIQNKTVLMKLPSFADAKSGKSSEPAVAKAEPKKADDKPLLAQKLVKADKPVEVSEAATHKVESGETLGSIAQKYYGASGPKTIAKIVDANKGLNPAKLKVGQEIVIPAKK